MLSESELRAFELAEGVTLPADYRAFLAHVGNGGAGPYYGLEPLGTCGGYPSRPFLLTQATARFSNNELERPREANKDPIALEFCHQGCGIFSYLVVNGVTYGTVWDGREDFYPTGMSFAVWYRRWAWLALRTVENEPLVARLRLGMSKAEIVAEVGGDWAERHVEFSTGLVRYFEADDIPAQIKLDESGRVAEVIPWDFITARP